MDLYKKYIDSIYGHLSSKKRQELLLLMPQYQNSTSKLMTDENVCKFIKSTFGYRKYKLGEVFDVDFVVKKIKPHLEESILETDSIQRKIEKDIGAINLWNEFEYMREEREAHVWAYVIAFCYLKVANGLIVEPPNISQKKIVGNGREVNFKEKASDAVGTALLGHFLGIPGIGLLAKWEEWDEERRKQKRIDQRYQLYAELYKNKFINPFDETMKLERVLKYRSIQRLGATILEISRTKSVRYE
ncbi:hypothetical protein ABE288_20485 [Bacillus salipaludis]|uniref:hypothetical protein n=1 Tax=Bacillus salipaludis TaxID=2547811 RepID=UPI003D2058AF